MKQSQPAGSIPGRRHRRRRLIRLALLLVLAATWIVIVGPWPAYRGGYAGTAYALETLGDIAAAAAQDLGVGRSAGSLRAGYGEAEITPPIGTPLAGYGQRRGAPSTGVHDPLYVKALALHDGHDEVVLVGSDLLLVPDSVAESALVQLAADPGLERRQVLFTASHTHSGPGGWAPGPIGRLFAGRRDAAVVRDLTERFVAAIRDAHRSLRPASIAGGHVEVPQLIRNRLIEGGETRPRLPILAVREASQDAGGAGALLAIATSYSAHPTVLGADNRLFSGDYPGAMQRHLAALTGAHALFLGGAVGSMGPRPPAAADAFARMEAMGEELARHANEVLAGLDFDDAVDLAGIAFPVALAPHQCKITDRLRLSPVLSQWLLRDRTTWLQAMRVGDRLWFGTPADLSGELANELTRELAAAGIIAEVCCFNGDYIGYVVPDRYAGMATYETRIMSWFGPATGSYLQDLMSRAGRVLLSAGVG